MVINRHLVPAGYADGEGQSAKEANYYKYEGVPFEVMDYYGYGDGGPEGDGEGDNGE